MAIMRQSSSLSRLSSRKRSLSTNLAQADRCWAGGVIWKTALSLTLLSNLLVFQVCRVLFRSHSTFDDLGLLLTSVSNGYNDGSQQHGVIGNPKPSYRLAWEQSYGFFEDISDADWIEFYQKPALAARHYRFENNPNQGAKFPAQWNFFNWDRYFNCPHLQKVGGLGGGAKWTCDVERLKRVVERRKRRAKKSESSEEGHHWYVLSSLYFLTHNDGVVSCVFILWFLTNL